MKKYIVFLLLVLLLTGCTEPAVTTAPSTTIPSTSQNLEQTLPTQAPPVDAPTTAPAPTEPVVVACSGHTSDPYENVDKEAFYANYTTACCYTDACYRTQHYLMSGSLEVPGQYATVSSYQPTDARGMLIRNTDAFYEDEGNTYVVVDAYGVEVMRL